MKTKKLMHRFTILFLSLLLLLALVYQYEKKERLAHFTPDYPPLHLLPILEELDYETFFHQTGLSPKAIHAQLEENQDLSQLNFYQDQFFTPIQMVCEKNTFLSAEEKTTTSFQLAPLEDGDILITFASHTITYRNGHCALVVDAKNEQTLESVVLGQNSSLQSLRKWTTYPNVIVLRLKDTSLKIRSNIAANAKKSLVDLPYRLSVGLFTKKDAFSSGTHCAHLVWQAFQIYGYDLDSDDGSIVTPFDLLQSNQLEIIQVYGVNPKDYVNRIIFP